MLAAQLREQTAQAGNHGCTGPRAVGRPDQDVEGTKIFLLKAKCLPNTTLDAISVRSAPGMLAGDEHAETRPPGVASPQVKGEALGAAARTLPQQLLELGFLPQPPACVQSETFAWRGYRPRRRRPLARRLAITLRPPGVRLRTRKPWVRARRVLDG